MRTKKQIKRLKAEIVRESAVEIGYNFHVLNHIPAYAILEACRKMLTWHVLPSKKNPELQNILVTEAVRALNYQDFKEVASYFFNYYKK